LVTSVNRGQTPSTAVKVVANAFNRSQTSATAVKVVANAVKRGQPQSNECNRSQGGSKRIQTGGKRSQTSAKVPGWISASNQRKRL